MVNISWLLLQEEPRVKMKSKSKDESQEEGDRSFTNVKGTKGGGSEQAGEKRRKRGSFVMYIYHLHTRNENIIQSKHILIIKI